MNIIKHENVLIKSDERKMHLACVECTFNWHIIVEDLHVVRIKQIYCPSCGAKTTYPDNGELNREAT